MNGSWDKLKRYGWDQEIWPIKVSALKLNRSSEAVLVILYMTGDAVQTAIISPN